MSKTSDGVGFIAGALPGEEVDAEVLEVRKKFWKGRAAAILSRSPLRRSGSHAEGCAGCDWSYFDLDAALGAKRDLFLETMERIGELSPRLFRELPIEPSPLAYRLRDRFHVAGRGEAASLGYFLPRTHRVEPAGDCEALSDSMRATLPRLREAIAASGAPSPRSPRSRTSTALGGSRASRFPPDADRRDANAVLESVSGLFDGVSVAGAEARSSRSGGERRLWIRIRDRDFPLTAGTFFQGNRHLLGRSPPPSRERPRPLLPAARSISSAASGSSPARCSTRDARS